MAGQLGRGSAVTSSAVVVAVAGAVLILCLLVPVTGAAAAKKQVVPRTYMVGDGNGWTRNLDWWVAGKTFYAGDVLVFKYDKLKHDVTVVGGKGYRRCEVPRHSSKSWVMRSGNDQVTLRRGNNYFICGLPGHCDNNMKLAVKAW